MLNFDPAAYGLSRGTTYGLDQYDPGWQPQGPWVQYNPSSDLGGNPGLSPWGYLLVTTLNRIPIRPGQGNAVYRGQAANGAYNYAVILRDSNDFQEVLRALQPGAQQSGTLPHLSVLLDNGMIPAGASSTPTRDQYVRDGLLSEAGIDVSRVRQEQMINDFIFGRITEQELAEFYALMVLNNAVLSPMWTGGALSGRGWLNGGFIRTGDGTVTFPAAPPVDAPTGGTTPLPPGFTPGPTETTPDGLPVVPIAGGLGGGGAAGSPGGAGGLMELEAFARRYWWAILGGFFVLGSMGGKRA